MPRKKILLVANTLWSVYNFRKGLIKSLIEKGYDVTIVAPEDDHLEKIVDLGCKFESISVSSQGKNPLKDLMLLFKLIKIYKKIKPDFIFHYTIKLNIYGSIAAGITNCKSIAVTTGLGFVFNKETLLTKFITQLYAFSFRFAKEVWFLNEDDRNVFLRKRIINESKSFILESEGVDTSYFTPSQVSCKTKYNDNVTFLLIARMLWEKGIGVYIDAANILKSEFPGIRFQLLGACDSQNPGAITRQEIENWQIKGIIEYLGVESDVRPHIISADCIVLPSFYREGVPRVLMEASSMCKPIITTNNVGCKDVVVDGETGYLCNVRDYIGLANVMRKFIELTPQERETMGKKGRDYIIKNFDERKIIKIYHDTLTKYIS
ncbi:glycosyltransferase family 4 protein [Escherichia coli]|nr:glycosyltransferase family 4 protein [Escherichia coli]